MPRTKQPAPRTRNNNGMGSIRRRPDGRWEARYSAPNGKQKSVYGKTEGEVTRKLKAALHDVDTGAWLEPSRMTLGEWLDVWLADYQGHTTGRTVESYRSAVEKQLKPALGAIRLGSLSKMHVRRLVNSMAAEDYAPATIRKALTILSTAMKCAIDAGLVRDDPTQGAKPPRIQKTKFSIVDRELIPAFIAAAEKTPHSLPFQFLLMTGLRVGELRGLRWEDVDSEDASLRVERQLYATSYSKISITPPKDGSARTIQLPGEALALLRRVRRDQLEHRMRAGDAWSADERCDGLIFRDERGRCLTESSMYRAVKRIGAEIGLPALRIHDLRHSYAVAALRSGIDVKTVQNNMGHKSAAMTLDTYAAYTTDAGRVAAQKFETYWKNAIHPSPDSHPAQKTN